MSIALPLYNAERFLRRALDSILAQDYADFEVVLSDNASSDSTETLCREYAARDSRFRYFRNPENIGQNPNFNRVFDLTRGEYFRWMGWDDWLEPTCLSRCVAALDAAPEAIGVTTLWHLVDDEGNVEFVEYKGRRPDGRGLFSRLRTTLYLLQAHRCFFDPMYSVFRREAIVKAGRLPEGERWADWMLAMELCLIGPYCHLEEVLSSRRDAKEPWWISHPRYDPRVRAQKPPSRRKMYGSLARVVGKHPLGLKKVPCWLAVYAYWLRSEIVRKWRWLVGGIRRRVFGRPSPGPGGPPMPENSLHATDAEKDSNRIP